jgi:tRNA-specific 2-thiouridylase
MPQLDTSLLSNFMPPRGARIAVAMSGGVDSSVVAVLLAEAGYEITGFTAWTLNGPGKCCNDALVNAGRVCEQLGVPYDTVDLRAEFFHYVMDYYHRSYEAGVTPNPCVECNRYVKWERMVDYARRELHCDYVATGHYAKLVQVKAPGGDRVKVYRPVDARKDQTYMMARVYPEDLARTVFPLAGMVKDEVYAIARAHDLPTAFSKESQDVCFVLDGQANYLKGALGVKPGPIVDVASGAVLGEHDGHYLFTVGQRKGVNVAAGRPIYVIKTDPKTNTVYVGDKDYLDTTEFVAVDVHWLDKPTRFPARVMAKLRYNSPAVLATLFEGDALGNYRVVLDEAFSGVTGGQISAFYDAGDVQLLGGGYIEKTLGHVAFDAALAPAPPVLGVCEV